MTTGVGWTEMLHRFELEVLAVVRRGFDVQVQRLRDGFGFC